MITLFTPFTKVNFFFFFNPACAKPAPTAALQRSSAHGDRLQSAFTALYFRPLSVADASSSVCAFMASPLVLPVAAAITSAAILHTFFLPEPTVTAIVCIICVCIHYATCSRPDSVTCCANTAFALSAAAAAGLTHAAAKGDSSNFGIFVAVVALYHCGEFFAVALSKPADVDNFGEYRAANVVCRDVCHAACSCQPQQSVRHRDALRSAGVLVSHSRLSNIAQPLTRALTQGISPLLSSV